MADHHDGTFTYTPSTGFSGVDSFSFVTTATAAGLPTLTISGLHAFINSTSTVTPDTVQYSLYQGQTLSVSAEDSVLNRSDSSDNLLEYTLFGPDGSTLTGTSQGGDMVYTTAGGTLAVHTDRSYDYEANEDFVGRDNISFCFGSTYDGAKPMASMVFDAAQLRPELAIDGNNGAGYTATLVADGNDLNGDGIPDFAEGYEDSYREEALGSSAPAFTALTITIPKDVSTSEGGGTMLELDYDESNPWDVAQTGAGTDADPYVYTPPTDGSLRIWTQDASALRLSGDFLASGVPFAASTLQWTSDASGITQTATVYVEAVQGGDEQEITATLVQANVGGNTVVFAKDPGTTAPHSDAIGVVPKAPTMNVLLNERVAGSNTLAESRKSVAGDGAWLLLDDANDLGGANVGVDKTLRPVPNSTTLYSNISAHAAAPNTNGLDQNFLQISLPILTTGPAATGYYRLLFGNSIRIYYKQALPAADGSAPADLGLYSQAIILPDNKPYTLYVEGITLLTPSQSPAATIELDYQKVGQQYKQADILTYLVYQIAGPQYVPDYSSYQFTENDNTGKPSAPEGAPLPVGTWAVIGANATGTTSPSNERQETVTFANAGGGPPISVQFTPASGFVGKRYVYVVGATINTGTATASKIVPGEFLINGVSVTLNCWKDPKLTTYLFQGETSSMPESSSTGIPRGLGYIQFGWLQLLTVNTWTMAGRDSKLVGDTFVDGATAGAPSSFPWANSGDAWGTKSFYGVTDEMAKGLSPYAFNWLDVPHPPDNGTWALTLQLYMGAETLDNESGEHGDPAVSRYFSWAQATWYDSVRGTVSSVTPGSLAAVTDVTPINTNPNGDADATAGTFGFAFAPGTFFNPIMTQLQRLGRLYKP